jgi:hypothetical protein
VSFVDLYSSKSSFVATSLSAPHTWPNTCHKKLDRNDEKVERVLTTTYSMDYCVLQYNGSYENSNMICSQRIGIKEKRRTTLASSYTHTHTHMCALIYGVRTSSSPGMRRALTNCLFLGSLQPRRRRVWNEPKQILTPTRVFTYNVIFSIHTRRSLLVKRRRQKVIPLGVAAQVAARLLLFVVRAKKESE